MKNILRIKALILALGLLTLGIAAPAADILNMHVDYNRFLDSEGNTLILLDYQATYSNLMFLASNKGYFAQLEVQASLVEADSVLFEQSVTDNIGISNKHDASSQRKSYLNRLIVPLSVTQALLSFKAKDLNSQNEFFWQAEVNALAPEARISDVELNCQVYADSSSYLQKFKRNSMVYEPIPSVLLSKSYSEYAHLYMELYSATSQIGQSYMLNLSLEHAGEYVMDEYFDNTFQKSTDSFSLKIPLADLAAGKYMGTITLQTDEQQDVRNFEFVLTEDIEQRYRIFEDPNDEYTLMRYFVTGNLPTNWDALNNETKTRYINNFWQNMASSSRMSEDDVIKMVDERIKYANNNFSSLKAGWTSDMGRIYIRNGAPSDIEKGITSDDTRFVRKDWQIWKFSTGNKAVYLFVDIQMNNNYRLIYTNGDNMESSNPDWLRYVGSEFDTDLLRN
ncbi:MAG: GWxTD domain-containing protein [Candidatus Cloacimonetes bacterium]|jgi:GWxTD domain-containing protein|nr:GWxTD domain-containing protein [Candidatus Cloacimonadota bacterium]MCK9335658.1 GWxTD domain-containing protein [Candidatus Cloacimonadota bacterium]MDD3096237.1 GWxTD domain-containing protein [Candidatus Cloacimonadota bacterium]MDD3578632.1 GWxTD domain-containing protein [Candidatus Cloacimonadota bacterium]MDY0337056.1 GWxTD domain-containing protein [Candidatus Cloacimonadaceae bacterium]